MVVGCIELPRDEGTEVSVEVRTTDLSICYPIKVPMANVDSAKDGVRAGVA